MEPNAAPPTLNQEKPSKNKKRTLIFSFIVFVIVLIFSLYISKLINQKTLNKSVDQIQISDTQKNGSTSSSIIPGWNHYYHQILGIEFDYPDSWGEVRTSPGTVINDLKAINKEFINSVDNEYKYMVYIQFSNNYEVQLKFYNDDFPGEKYPNSYAYQYGSIGNFDQLRKTGNICNYHISFDHRPQYPATMNEIYNNCRNNIKTVMVLNSPNIVNTYNNKTYYNFNISQYFYKKLNNGYFDHLFIKNNIGSTQLTNNNLTYESFKDTLQAEGKYQDDVANFEKFVKTIKTFTPPAPTPIIFTEKSGEDSNITTIRRYYHYLATQNLSAAYDMYQNKNITFDEYVKWYDQILNTNVSNISQTQPNTYTFNVILTEKNQPNSLYKVVMEVNNNKINTLYSEEITSDEVKFNNLSAYTRLRSGKNEVVLIQNGKEQVVDSGDNDWTNKMSTSHTFNDLKFSPQGNYLTYIIGGWEYFGGRIYDIKNNKLLNNFISDYPQSVTISPNEKYVVNCAGGEFGGGYDASVYTLPDFKNQFDFLKYADFNKEEGRKCLKKDGSEEYLCDYFRCNFNQDNSVVTFLLKSQEYIRPEDFKDITVRYDLNSNQIIK